MKKRYFLISWFTFESSVSFWAVNFWIVDNKFPTANFIKDFIKSKAEDFVLANIIELCKTDYESYFSVKI